MPLSSYKVRIAPRRRLLSSAALAVLALLMQVTPVLAEDVGLDPVGELFEVEVTETAEPSTTEFAIPTEEPTATAAPTDTSVATATDTSIPAATNTSVPQATDTGAPTATDTAVPVLTDTSAPTATDTSGPTATETAASTATGTVTATVTQEPSETDTATPTYTPDDTQTPRPESHCGTSSPDRYSGNYVSTDEGQGAVEVAFQLSIENDGESLQPTLTLGGVAVSVEIVPGSCQGCYTISSKDPLLSINLEGYSVSSFSFDDGSGALVELKPADGTPASVKECHSVTLTATATETPADTAVSTATPTEIATATGIATAIDTATATATAAETATARAIYTETATATSTETPTETFTTVPTATATMTASASATRTATATVTPKATATEVPKICLSEDTISQKIADLLKNQGVPNDFNCDAVGSDGIDYVNGHSQVRYWEQTGLRTFPEDLKNKALFDPQSCTQPKVKASSAAREVSYPWMAGAKVAGVSDASSSGGAKKCCFYQYSDEKSQGGGSAADGHKFSARVFGWEWARKYDPKTKTMVDDMGPDGKRDPNCDVVFDCPMLNAAAYPKATTQRSCHLTRVWDTAKDGGKGNYVRLITWGLAKRDADPYLDAQDFVFANKDGKRFETQAEALNDFRARTGLQADRLPATAVYFDTMQDNRVVRRYRSVKSVKSLSGGISTAPILADRKNNLSPIGRAAVENGCTSQKHAQLTHANPSFGFQMCKSIFRDCLLEGAVLPDGTRPMGGSYQAQVHGCSQIGFAEGMCKAVDELVDDFKKRCQDKPKKNESLVLIGNQIENWHPDAAGSKSCTWSHPEGYAKNDNFYTLRKFKVTKNGFIVCRRDQSGQWVDDTQYCRGKNYKAPSKDRSPELTCASSNRGL